MRGGERSEGDFALVVLLCNLYMNVYKSNKGWIGLCVSSHSDD